MKIKLIKLKFNDTHSYKYKPFTYCCNKIQNDKAIVFTGEDINDIGGEYKDEGISIPHFCTSHTKMNGNRLTIILFGSALTVERRLGFQL